MNFPRFQDQVAIITGASRGIGLAVARRLVDEGARVCLTARKRETLEHAVEDLGGPGVALGVVGDAADPLHQEATVAATLSRWGRIHVLVNNTGINAAYGPLLDTDDEAARKIFEVNLLGTMGWIRRAWRAHFADHGGCIVNMTSVAGLRPAAGIGFYGTSKAALVHVTQQLAVELAPSVRVNAVAPAIVRTRFATPLFGGREPDVAAGYALGRIGEPEDVAAAVAYLGSTDAAWVTGQTLVVDGGLTLRGGV